MKKTLYLLALGVFGIATTEFGVIGILPQIAAHFKISVEKAGWLLSSFALVIAVFGPFMTILFSGINRKKALLFVLAVFTISNIISVIAPNFAILLIARILPAFLHPVYWSISLSVAAASVDPKDSPKAVSIVFGGFTIASVLGIPLATFMATLFNWQVAFLLCAAVNLLTLLGLMVMFPPMAVVGRMTFRNQLKVFKTKKLWIQLAIACLMIAAMYASYGYFAVYLGEITGMNGSQISLMLLLFGVSGVAGNWLAGKMLSKSVPGTTIGFILLLLTIHLILYYAGINFPVMVILIVVWGFIHTGGFLISNINVTSAATQSPEFINSIFTSCGNLAVTIGTTLGGVTLTRFNVHQIMLTSIILLMVAAAIWPASRKTFC